ncbi:MAG TPA: glycosyltransferase family 2 protein [Polyangiaceae bacterium]|nr:glycosyltransferase family 2 protein [Polyangiaceae bacterium]
MRLSVLIPAWNEQATIVELLERVLREDLSELGVLVEVIVCDDGSSDETAQLAREVQSRHGRLVLVGHQRNRGKGAAVRTALEHATGDFVLIQDADLECSTSEYAALMTAALRGAEVVYGSRFLLGRYPSGMRLSHYLGNRLLTAVANTLFDLRLTDQATCLKLFRTGLLRSLELTAERFEFCPEVNAKLGLRGVAIEELPVQYQARSKAQGKKVSFVDAVEALWTMARLYGESRWPRRRAPSAASLGFRVEARGSLRRRRIAG